MRCCACVFALMLLVSSRVSADPPAAPPVSRFAPAADVAALVDRYVGLCEKHLADPAQWEPNAPLIKKDGATLVVAALAAGLDDGGNKYTEAGPALYRAAQKLAQAGDHAAAAQALADVKTALASQGGEPLDWNAKHASMGQLMKQVTFVYNRLKRAARPDRLARQKDECCLDATALAAIAQAVTADTHEVKDASKTDQWYEMCADMRDCAAEVRTAAAAGDPAQVGAALQKLDESCVKCHQVFRPDQL